MKASVAKLVSECCGGFTGSLIWTCWLVGQFSEKVGGMVTEPGACHHCRKKVWKDHGVKKGNTRSGS